MTFNLDNVFDRLAGGGNKLGRDETSELMCLSKCAFAILSLLIGVLGATRRRLLVPVDAVSFRLASQI